MESFSYEACVKEVEATRKKHAERWAKLITKEIAMAESNRKFAIVINIFYLAREIYDGKVGRDVLVDDIVMDLYAATHLLRVHLAPRFLVEFEPHRPVCCFLADEPFLKVSWHM